MKIYEDVSIILSRLQLVPDCGSGLWFEVGRFDLRSESQQCPSPWVEMTFPTRSCVVNSTLSGSLCEGSLFFSAQGVTYSRVCGRAIGHTESISSYRAFATTSQDIDRAYVDGVSVTHGSPRQHIWTFAASYNSRSPCPLCSSQRQGRQPPSFVGSNYFCDDPSSEQSDGMLSFWTGVDCLSDCCSFKNPPWFNVTLPVPTSDDIEVRMCADGTGRIPVSMLQLLVQ